jgi:hypothetical protein
MAKGKGNQSISESGNRENRKSVDRGYRETDNQLENRKTCNLYYGFPDIQIPQITLPLHDSCDALSTGCADRDQPAA